MTGRLSIFVNRLVSVLIGCLVLAIFLFYCRHTFSIRVQV